MAGGNLAACLHGGRSGGGGGGLFGGRPLLERLERAAEVRVTYLHCAYIKTDMRAAFKLMQMP